MRFKKSTFAVVVISIVILAACWHYVYKNSYLRSAYPQQYYQLVEKYSSQYGVNDDLIYAVIKNESNFTPTAKSSIGAMGLMQLTPETFDWALSKTGEKETYSDQDLYRPEVNIKYGTLVLSALMKEFKNTDTTIAAYHAGRSNVKKWLANPTLSKSGKTLDYIPFGDTRSYVKKVLNTQKMYQSVYKESSGS